MLNSLPTSRGEFHPSGGSNNFHGAERQKNGLLGGLNAFSTDFAGWLPDSPGSRYYSDLFLAVGRSPVALFCRGGSFGASLVSIHSLGHGRSYCSWRERAGSARAEPVGHVRLRGHGDAA